MTAPDVSTDPPADRLAAALMAWAMQAHGLQRHGLHVLDYAAAYLLAVPADPNPLAGLAPPANSAWEGLSGFAVDQLVTLLRDDSASMWPTADTPADLAGELRALANELTAAADIVELRADNDAAQHVIATGLGGLSARVRRAARSWLTWQ